LIEAADHLPEWLDESVDDRNRTFLMNGNVHLIPTQFDTKPMPYARETIETQRDGCDIVRKYEKETLVSKAIEKNCVMIKVSRDMQTALNSRMCAGSTQHSSQMHKTHVLVPSTLAYTLRTLPYTLPQAIHAFANRTPHSMQVGSLVCRIQTMLTGMPTFANIHK
jgi:hypothetical protein